MIPDFISLFQLPIHIPTSRIHSYCMFLRLVRHVLTLPPYCIPYYSYFTYSLLLHVLTASTSCPHSTPLLYGLTILHVFTPTSKFLLLVLRSYSTSLLFLLHVFTHAS